VLGVLREELGGLDVQGLGKHFDRVVICDPAT
jgi:hypothetical protein